VYEGRILTGAGRSCLEIGHIQVMAEGPRCGCGQRGCLETVAGRLAIAGEAVKAAFRGQAPHLVERCGTDLAEVRSGDLAAAIEAGDREIERIVREAARWLGVGVANVINLLAPDVVVLGGGLVEAMPRLFQEQVESAARGRVMAGLSRSFKVVVGALGDNAIPLGAAAWARDCAGSGS
jgi:glucokinase